MTPADLNGYTPYLRKALADVRDKTRAAVTAEMFAALGQVVFKAMAGGGVPDLLLKSAAWDESQHPRDHGKFSSTPGEGGGEPEGAPPADKGKPSPWANMPTEFHSDRGRVLLAKLTHRLRRAIRQEDDVEIEDMKRKAARVFRRHYDEAADRAVSQMIEDFPAFDDDTDGEDVRAAFDAEADQAANLIDDLVTHAEWSKDDRAKGGGGDYASWNATFAEVEDFFTDPASQHRIWDAIQAVRDRLGGSKEKGHTLGRYFKSAHLSPESRLVKSAAALGLSDALASLSPWEYADLLADVADECELERVTKADRSHLVRKVITNRLGHRQVVWVNPAEADQTEISGQSRGQQYPGRPGMRTGGQRHMSREQQQASREVVAKAVENPESLTHEEVKNLVDHIDAITKEEAQGLLRVLRLKVSGGQYEVAQRLYRAVKRGREEAGRQEEPPAAKTTAAKPAKKTSPKARKGATGESLAAVVRSYGGLDPNSHALKAHFGDMRESLEYGFSLGMFKKGGRGLDQMAQELASAGHITVPDGADPGQHLVDKITAKASSDLYDRTEELKQAEEDYYSAMAAVAAEKGVGYEYGADLTAEQLFGDDARGAAAYRGADAAAAEAAASDPYGGGGERDGGREGGGDTSFDFGHNAVGEGTSSGTSADKPKVEYVRAPAGGATSDVDGKHYRGGQLMPVHGKYSGQAKPPKGDGVGVATEAQANPDAEGESGDRRPTRPLSPEDAAERRAELEREQKVREIQAGPLGGLMRHDRNKGVNPTHGIGFKQWQQFAEKVGEGKLKHLAAALPPPTDAAEREDYDYQLNHPQDFKATQTKKHAVAFPSSADARHAVQTALENAKTADDVHRIHQLLSSTPPIDTTPPAEPVAAPGAEPGSAPSPTPAPAPATPAFDQSTPEGRYADHARKQLPESVPAVPKTKAARTKLAADLKAAWLGTVRALGGEGNLTAEQQAAHSGIAARLETLATGKEADGPHDLGPVSDQRYAGYYRGVVASIDKLRAAAGGGKSPPATDVDTAPAAGDTPAKPGGGKVKTGTTKTKTADTPTTAAGPLPPAAQSVADHFARVIGPPGQADYAVGSVADLRAARPSLEKMSKAEVDALSRHFELTPLGSKKATIDNILRAHESQLMSRLRGRMILGLPTEPKAAETPPAPPPAPAGGAGGEKPSPSAPSSAPATPPPAALPDVPADAATDPDKHAEAGKRVLASPAVRQAVTAAYTHLSKFPEFRDGLVDLPSMYYEVRDRVPGLTVPQFQAAVWQLGKSRAAQLHVNNSGEGKDAAVKSGSLDTNDRFYHYIRLNTTDAAGPT